MVKKLLVSICLLVSVCCFLMGGQLLNNYTTYAEEKAETYELNFNGEAGKFDNVATTGMRKNADLTGGKSLVALMDIKDAKLDTSTNLGVFFRITDDSLANRNWPPEFVSAYSRLNMNGDWKSSGKNVGKITLHDLFKAGNTLKIEYKPFVDSGNMGSFSVSVKKTGNDDGTYTKVINIENLPENKAKPKVALYISTYGGMKLTVSNYTIKTSDGTLSDNSYTYSYRGIENEGKYEFDTSMSISRITEDKNTYHISFFPESSYFGAEKGTDIKQGNALIMEYDVLESNLENNNFNTGFVVTTVDNFNDDWIATNGETFSVVGNSMLDKEKYPSYSSGAFVQGGTASGTEMTGEFIPYKIFASGNRVKAVYKPYVDELNKGSFEIYTAPIINGKYSLQFKISGIDKKYALDKNVRIHMILQNTVSWLKDKEFTLHISNYRIYTSDNEMDRTKDIQGFGSHDKCIIKEVEVPVSYQPTFSADSKKQVIIKPGWKIHLSTNATFEEGYEFDGWYYMDNTTQEEILVSTKTEFDYVVEGPVDLYIKQKLQKRQVTITGGKVNTKDNSALIDWGGTAYILADINPDGKILAGWKINIDGQDETVENSYKAEKVSSDRYIIYNVKDNITVSPLYDNIKFSVKLINANYNGQTEFESEINSEITVTANPAMEGYKFTCFMVNDEVVNGENTLTIKVNGNLIINAVYERIALTVKVTGGTYSAPYDTTYYGDMILLTPEIKDGYEFTGWYKNGELVSDNENYTFTLKENVEFTAQYKQVEKSGCNGSFSGNNFEITLFILLSICFVKGIKTLKGKKTINR